MAQTMNLNPVEILRTKMDAANELGRKIQAAKSDKGAAVAAILETSDDPTIVKYRAKVAEFTEQIETLQAKLENGKANILAHAETLLPDVEEGFDLETAQKAFAELRKSATVTRTAIENLVGDKEIVAQMMKENGITEIVSVKGKGTAKSGATGIRRPRISAATLNGAPVFSDKEQTKVDFTGLAKAAKSDAQTLKTAAFAAAETEDLNSLAEGTVVSFAVGDNKFTVTVSGEKPGRKPAEKSEEVAA